MRGLNQRLPSADSFSDYATIKYSGAGVALWTNRYNGPVNNPDVAYAIAVDGSGNVFVTGGSIGSGSSEDYATIKYSGAGVALWTNRYNGPGNSDDQANAMAVDGSGNVIVTGRSYANSTNSDYATIKYSGAGVPLWTNRYHGPGNYYDYATAMAVDGSGNVFVTGYSYDTNTFYDYVTIKYSGPPPFGFSTTGGSLGLVNKQFRFNLTGPAGSNVVISASTNLQTWIPLVTNLLTGGSLNYTDTLATNYLRRFYRATLGVLPLLITNLPPAITIQPQGQTNAAGNNITFTVTATGTPTLFYQWRKNATNLVGQTAVSLALNSVATNDSGNYTVVITNVAGSVTSSVAPLLITNLPPSITTQPQGQTNVVGNNIMFTVTATGTPTLFYQWRKNATNLVGQTATSLSLSSVTTNASGNYTVVITNVAGSVTSSVAPLLITNLPPSITTQPQGQTNVVGNNITFTVTATGTPTLFYQWRKNATNLVGQTATSLALNSVATNDSGNYTVVITNAAGSVTSSVAVLLITTTPVRPTGVYMGQFTGEADNGGFGVLVRSNGLAYLVGYNTLQAEGVSASGFSVAVDGKFATVTGNGGHVGGTFTSTAVSGVFTNSLGSSGTYSGTRKADTGIHAADAGYYTGTFNNLVAGITGTTSLVLAADGTAFFYSADSTGDGGGSGTINSANTVSATTVPDGYTVSGILNTTTKVISGSFKSGTTTVGTYSITRTLAP